MKSLRLEGIRTLKLREVDSPEASENHAVICVEAVGIGGSEYLGFNNPGIRSLPNAMGHGFTGSTSNGVRVAVYPLTACGKCDYCVSEQSQLCEKWSLVGVQSDGGFSQKVNVLRDHLIEIPQSLSWQKAVFIEPFANSINAWELSNATSENSIAIVGIGSLGLGLIACALKAGCKSIHIAEHSENRRNAAISLGATLAQQELNENYDIVFDTVGSTEARDQAISATRKGGKCVFLGFENPYATVNMAEIIRFQKTLIGSFVYSKKQFIDAIGLVECCNDNWVKDVDFEEVEEHLVQFLEGDFSCIKLALRPNG